MFRIICTLVFDLLDYFDKGFPHWRKSLLDGCGKIYEKSNKRVEIVANIQHKFSNFQAAKFRMVGFQKRS